MKPNKKTGHTILTCFCFSLILSFFFFSCRSSRFLLRASLAFSPSSPSSFGRLPIPKKNKSKYWWAEGGTEKKNKCVLSTTLGLFVPLVFGLTLCVRVCVCSCVDVSMCECVANLCAFVRLFALLLLVYALTPCVCV